MRGVVTDFKAHIEAIRSTRDLKLAGIERIQKDLQVLGDGLGWGRGWGIVTDFTAHIEAMRSTRDLKLADIERIQKDLQVLGGGWGEVG